MRARQSVLALFAVLIVALPARAYHPGADLDRVMGSKKHYFQPVDKAAGAAKEREPG